MSGREPCRGRRGAVLVLGMASSLVAVLAILCFRQAFRSAVNGQRDAATGGLRATLLADSALSEALHAVRRAANDPTAAGGSWHRRLREPLPPSGHPFYEASVATPLARRVAEEEGLVLEEVRVAAWAQVPLGGSPYAKCGLITATAAVGFRRRSGASSGKLQWRNLQRSYDFRCTVAAPRSWPGLLAGGRRPDLARLACWRFADQAAFHARLEGRSIARLDGLYLVEGSARLSLPRYTGRGVVVTTGRVELGACGGEAGGSLTVVSAGGLRLLEDVDAAVLAPSGALELEGHEARGGSGEFDPRRTSGGEPPDVCPDDCWVTVSPAEVGRCYVRRKG